VCSRATQRHTRHKWHEEAHEAETLSAPIHPHTHTHTPIHTYTHTHIHTYTHTPTPPYTHTQDFCTCISHLSHLLHLFVLETQVPMPLHCARVPMPHAGYYILCRYAVMLLCNYSLCIASLASAYGVWLSVHRVRSECFICSFIHSCQFQFAALCFPLLSGG
jgi:hypothetical protein